MSPTSLADVTLTACASPTPASPPSPPHTPSGVTPARSSPTFEGPRTKQTSQRSNCILPALKNKGSKVVEDGRGGRGNVRGALCVRAKWTKYALMGIARKLRKGESLTVEMCNGNKWTGTVCGQVAVCGNTRWSTERGKPGSEVFVLTP